jgi:hypothetical protein
VITRRLWVIGCACALTVGAVGCHGDYSVSIYNARLQEVEVRTSDSHFWTAIAPCSRRRFLMAYVPGEEWTITARDAQGRIIYSEKKTLAASTDGPLLFSVTIPADGGQRCP